MSNPKSGCPPRHPIVGEVAEDGNLKLLIGVDPHKASSTAAVLADDGAVLAQARFPSNRTGLRALERFGQRFPERRWAVESGSGLGRSVAQRLVRGGEDVVDVPAQLSARPAPVHRQRAQERRARGLAFLPRSRRAPRKYRG